MNRRDHWIVLFQTSMILSYIQTSTLTAPPKFNLDNLEEEYILKVGSAKVIEVPFSANPMPDVNWTWNGGAFPDAKRIKAETIRCLSSVTMAKLQRKDSGRFEVKVENKYGKATSGFKLTVIGKSSESALHHCL